MNFAGEKFFSLPKKIFSFYQKWKKCCWQITSDFEIELDTHLQTQFTIGIETIFVGPDDTHEYT